MIPALLNELLRASAPSGSEEDVMAVVRREAAAFASVESDVHGNTIARIAGSPGGRTLALFAHADEIGMLVTHVHEDGLASVARLGDWDAVGAVCRRVEVRGRAGRVPGVVVRVGGGTGDPAWTDLRLDVGAADAGEALALVEPGDALVMTGEPVMLGGGRVMSKSLDNRVGVYVALETARRLAADPVAWDVPGTDAGAWGNSRLGAGPTVFRGPTIHPAVAAGLRAAAAEAGIDYTIEVASVTWSDSEAVQEALAGTPVGLVSIPLRSMHTANEIVQLSDVDAASRLAEAYARALPLDLSFVR